MIMFPECLPQESSKIKANCGSKIQEQISDTVTQKRAVERNEKVKMQVYMLSLLACILRSKKGNLLCRSVCLSVCQFFFVYYRQKKLSGSRFLHSNDQLYSFDVCLQLQHNSIIYNSTTFMIVSNP